MVDTTTYSGTRDQAGVAFTVTNLTVATSMDCSAVADNAIADTLGTLIRELISKGIIKGSTVTH